ncbi:MAG TPA: hypothetical protein PKA00_17565 [Saprospiraceae bacterium]|nr:hypothetical protein [Saprospiraceae bacterium]HMQ84730.1 hypothetical protein [Saprospiraceae bacterium]
MKSNSSIFSFATLLCLILVAGCNGCNSCEEGNVDSKLVIFVELPKESDGGCLYDWYPYYQMIGQGISPVCLFTYDFSNSEKHYLELEVSGECFDGEFTETFKGARDPQDPANHDGCIITVFGDIGVIASNGLVDVLALCVTIPWSQHHGFIDFNISLTYRTVCTTDSSCPQCQNGNYYGYYRHEGVLRYEAPTEGETECTSHSTLYYVDRNQFEYYFLDCVSSQDCKP